MKLKLPLLVTTLFCYALVADTDPHQWLEEIESPAALDWARAHNDKSVPHFVGTPIFRQIEPEIRRIALATDRIPHPILMGPWVYNFWQDAKQVRGLWRRATLESYVAASPHWETVLDLDALATEEKENWVWKGADCLAPQYRRCLVNLSRGGKDAVVVREWDNVSKTFVADGFKLPEAKSRIAWLDENTLLLGTDEGADSLTLSGYPRFVRTWKRATKFESAPLLFEGKKQDMMVNASVFRDGQAVYAFVHRRTSFFEQDIFMVNAGKVSKLALPTDVELQGVAEGRLLFQNKKPFKRGKQSVVAGALMALPLGRALSNGPAEIIYAPHERASISQVTIAGNQVLLNLLEEVKGRLVRYEHTKKGWVSFPVPLPQGGTLSVIAADDVSENSFATFESFLTPPSLYFLSRGSEPKKVMALPARFDASPYETNQHWVTSADGTKVPYFVVHKRGMALDGTNPTLLYAYGGFLLAQKPGYLSATGKVWLERGGVYVVANIRGGNEFGPQWHQAALKEKRQNAYNDFIAVAEDLIAKKITSPSRLGIRGGSNGGLLMGVMFTQRPDLFGAVVCQVPLLDMLRFHKLLAGHSWTAEYGNPDVPAEAAYIAKYSPYQNVKAQAKYPKMFVLTSTKDDRVHPGHARKMVAKLEAMNHPVYYYENIEGGHGGAANLEQTIRNTALYFSYLFEQIGETVKLSSPVAY